MKISVMLLTTTVLLSACGNVSNMAANGDSGDFLLTAQTMSATESSSKEFFCFAVPEQNPSSAPSAPGAPLLCELISVSETSFRGICQEGEFNQARQELQYSNGTSVPVSVVSAIVSPDMNGARAFFENPPYAPVQVIKENGSITVQNPAAQEKLAAKDACVPVPKQ
ncbi:MAG: hypothetical protein A2X94_07205 [Bdellovibrionales bacterium GWB1_55_8]|nr:MAG: hypothetical protein A2X94_07205 [Bdellovibrionales bacterium GWB1_55_8]